MKKMLDLNVHNITAMGSLLLILTSAVILLNHIHHLQKQLTLHIIKYIKVFSNKPDSFRQFVVSFAGPLDFNREIMEFQLLFLFSFVLGSAFREDKVSSLNKFKGVFAQRHSFMKATNRRHALIFETENIQSRCHNEQLKKHI